MEHFKISKEDGLQIITFNRPTKKNALSLEMLNVLPQLLQEAAKDPEVIMLAFTGEGDYFTSGNDITNFLREPDRLFREGNEEYMQEIINQGRTVVHNIVKAFIDFPKPLVAVVNGPAVGIGVTLLGLFDYVCASDLATFHCPFTKLGLAPEGCSTHTFPQMMGNSKAAEILLFGRKLSAVEACRRNLVTEVVAHEAVPFVWERIRKMVLLPSNTLLKAKGAMKESQIAMLHQANNRECDALMMNFCSAELLESLVKFMSRKSKL